MDARQPNKAALALAVVVPIGLAVFGMIGFLVMAGGVTRMAHMFQEGGPMMLVLVPIALFATVFAGVFAMLGGRGQKIPAALIVGAAVLPALLGLLGTVIGMSKVTAAIRFADPSMKMTMLAVGISEASLTRMVGMWWTGMAGLGAAFALGAGALARRAEGGSPGGIPVGIGGGGVVVIFAIVGALGGPYVDPMNFLLVLYAVFVTFALALAGRAVGRDDPNDRAAVYAMATPIAGAVGFFGFASALVWAQYIKVFGAVASADPSMKARLLLAAAREIEPMANVAQYGVVVWFLPVAALAGWTVMRTQEARPARFVGLAVSLVVAGVAPFVAMLLDDYVGDVMAQTRPAPFADVPGDFQPIELEEGEPVGGFDDVLLVAGELRAIGPSVRPEGSDRHLAIAVDRRVTAVRLQTLVRAAEQADVDVLTLVGRASGGLSDAEIAELESIAPMFTLFGDQTFGIPVRLGKNDANEGKVEMQTELRYGDYVSILDAHGEKIGRLDEHRRDLTEVTEGAIVWVTIADDAPAKAVFEGLERLERARLTPHLASEPLPTPEAPPPSASGTLEKGLIRRVIRGATPRIRFCYEKALMKRPELFGKVVAKFVIGTNGRVREAEIETSTMQAPEVESCIARTLSRLRFPAPTGGEVVVRYPFVLKTN